MKFDEAFFFVFYTHIYSCVHLPTSLLSLNFQITFYDHLINLDISSGKQSPVHDGLVDNSGDRNKILLFRFSFLCIFISQDLKQFAINTIISQFFSTKYKKLIQKKVKTLIILFPLNFHFNGKRSKHLGNQFKTDSNNLMIYTS